MTLTAQQLTNTQAAAFDVRLRYFADESDFNDRADLANYTADAAPTGWTISGDTITPGGSWADITSRVVGEGTFTQEWTEGRLGWRVQLRGWDYDPDKLGVGKSVLCLRRITVGAYDSTWVLYWLGVVAAGQWAQDYRDGDAWQREVLSVDGTLTTADCPHLSTALLNLAEGATITASSTLAVPAAEAGNGEFVGATANVEPGNAIDQRPATVWISADPVGLTSETPGTQTGAEAESAFVVNEFFMKPLPGYSASDCWWIEIADVKGGHDWNLDAQSVIVWVRNSAGHTAGLLFANAGSEWQTSDGGRAIICGNEQAFEAYTGGARDADFVLDVRKWRAVDFADYSVERTFNLHPTDGYICILYGGHGDRVHWGSPTMDAELIGGWAGAGLSMAALPDGWSWRRRPTEQDSDTIADWGMEANPRPGEKWAASTNAWLQVILREHTSTLSTETAAGATTLTFDEGTDGWSTRQGDGIIEGDTFTYTGRSATQLTGVSGLGSAHAKGARALPTDSDGTAQTGWLLRSATLKRLPGRSTITRARLRTSIYENPATPDSDDWEIDYEGPELTGTTTGPELTFQIGPVRDERERPLPGTDWVRTLLFQIDEMSDGGRAKCNEIEVAVDELQLNITGAINLDTATIADVAQYLVGHYTWLASASLVTNSLPAGSGQLGEIETRVASVPDVLVDLARCAGAVIEFTRDGKLAVLGDPWWPNGATTAPEGVLDEGEVRGEFAIEDAPGTVRGVGVSCQDGTGSPLARVTWPRGVTGTGIQELSGLVVATASLAEPLALNMWRKTSETRRIGALTIKGPGEWCKPTQRVLLEWAGARLGQWVIERVTQRWSNRDGKRTWRTELGLKKYFAG